MNSSTGTVLYEGFISSNCSSCNSSEGNQICSQVGLLLATICKVILPLEYTLEATAALSNESRCSNNIFAIKVTIIIYDWAILAIHFPAEVAALLMQGYGSYGSATDETL